MKYVYTSYDSALMFIMNYSTNETYILVHSEKGNHWKQIENYFKPNYYSDEIGITTEEFEFFKNNPGIWI